LSQFPLQLYKNHFIADRIARKAFCSFVLAKLQIVVAILSKHERFRFANPSGR
jgi:hypothetical protein